MNPIADAWAGLPDWAKPRRIHRIAVPLAIFAVALTVRAIYLVEDLASPFFVAGGIDTPTYLMRARSLLAGTWPDAFAFNQPPLYPIVLAAVSFVTGGDVFGLKAFQLLLGAATCSLVYAIAGRLFRDFRVACVAGLLCAFNGTFIYFDGQIVPASLESFLQVAALLLLLRATSRDRALDWLLAGVVLGLSAVNRGAILVCLPWVALWLFVGRTAAGEAIVHDLRHGASRVALLALPIVACLAPVVWHNFDNDVTRMLPPALRDSTREEARAHRLERFLSGDYVTLTARIGMNLALGNDPDNYAKNDPNHPLCQQHTNYVLKRAYREAGARSASAQSKYLSQQTRKSIAEAPGEWLELIGTKTLQLLGGTEIPRNANAYADRQYSLVLSTLLWHRGIAFPTGLLIPLGLLGVFLDRRNWRERGILLAFLVPRALFVLAFFVAARLRLPLLPIVSIYAAFASCRAFELARARSWRSLSAIAVAFVVLVGVSNAPITPVARGHGAYEYANLARQLHDDDQFAPAAAAYAKAIEIDPTSPTPRYLFGLLLMSRGEFERAEEHLEAAVESDPQFVEARMQLARALERSGRIAEARAHLETIVADDPSNRAARRALKRFTAATEDES